MQGNQQLPDLFVAHRHWILNRIKDTNDPDAWIFCNGTWLLQRSHYPNNRIEHLEYILTAQENIGMLRFTATLNSSNAYTIIYLYDGTMFSHSIFQARNISNAMEHQVSKNEQQWWIEPWNIGHLLS